MLRRRGSRIGLTLLTGLCVSASAAAEVTTDWFRDPAISPDGRTVVFSRGGDLYSVSIDGGRAIPLTVHPAHESSPVWSRDGKLLAFASDRLGNLDVFVMPSGGGEATRLTHYSTDDTPSDFTPDGSAVLFSSSRVDDVASVIFPSGVMSELYEVSVEGGTPAQRLTTPALNARLDSAGQRLLYEDIKGYEDPLRKHHTSSVTRDVWLYDASSGAHKKLTEFAGEDRDPEWSENERAMYFLSERAGDFNVFRMPLRPGSRAEQITFFEGHPVRGLSRAEDGELVFSWHGDLYRLHNGSEPERIDIEIAVDTAGDEPKSETKSGGATEFSVSPDGKEIAFIVRGEVFVTSVDFSTTRRITTTPEQERSVDFAPDGRSLVYAGERDGSWNVYQATLVDEDELYFFSGTKIEEKPLIATDAEEFQPAYSPDGKKVAYLHNRSVVMVHDLESGENVVALPGEWYYSYSDGDHWFDWSPDSEWLAVHFYQRDRVFVPEAGLVRADGSSDAPINLSKSGYSDGNPHWAFEGGAIIWSSDRYGERSHGSWGAESDVIGAFLTQDAYDRFTLSKEEYELKKELEKKREETKDEAAGDADEGEAEEDGEKKEDEEEKVEPVELELDGLESRTMRLTIHASDLGDFEMTPKGEKLFYLARFEKGYDLWEHDFREETTKLLTKLGAGSASMELSEDGETIYLLADGSLSKVDAKSGEKKGISFKAALEIDGMAERAYLFDHVWRQAQQKFYRPDLHGVDWRWMREQYEPKLKGLTNNRDLSVVLSELLGELNASHTGGRWRPGGEEGDDQTAALGVFYDEGFTGTGMKIAEIMEGGPLDRAELDIEAGMVITHVDGERIDRETNFYSLLDGKTGDRVRLTLRREDGESFDEVVKPISLGAESNLRYERWVKSRRELVDRLSNGRLGYVHIRGMNDASYREFYSETMGRHAGKEGLVVDTRFNGGGWLHDDLATFLTGENYVNYYPRDDESPNTWYYGDSMWRWTKPSIVVMSESNYSDAHAFPWAYTELDIGDTVGMPVPGTMTAVWWERLHTGDIVFGIPQVGAKGADGEYLENKQLDPTHEVPLDPVSAAEGRDTQIIKAVEVLMRQVERGGR